MNVLKTFFCPTDNSLIMRLNDKEIYRPKSLEEAQFIKKHVIRKYFRHMSKHK